MKEVWVNQGSSYSCLSSQTEQLGVDALVREVIKKGHCDWVQFGDGESFRPTTTAAALHLVTLRETGPMNILLSERPGELQPGSFSGGFSKIHSVLVQGCSCGSQAAASSISNEKISGAHSKEDAEPPQSWTRHERFIFNRIWIISEPTVAEKCFILFTVIRGTEIIRYN